jgi:hypothetical protein
LPSEAKLLFRAEALRPKLAAFTLPSRAEARRDKLAHWADLLTSDQANSLKERELLPDFISDIFIGLLGYTGPADGGRITPCPGNSTSRWTGSLPTRSWENWVPRNDSS